MKHVQQIQFIARTTFATNWNIWILGYVRKTVPLNVIFLCNCFLVFYIFIDKKKSYFFFLIEKLFRRQFYSYCYSIWQFNVHPLAFTLKEKNVFKFIGINSKNFQNFSGEGICLIVLNVKEYIYFISAEVHFAEMNRGGRGIKSGLGTCSCNDMMQCTCGPVHFRKTGNDGSGATGAYGSANKEVARIKKERQKETAISDAHKGQQSRKRPSPRKK